MAEGQTCATGHQVPAGALYCSECGARVVDPTPAATLPDQPPPGRDPAAQHPTLQQPGWDEHDEPTAEHPAIRPAVVQQPVWAPAQQFSPQAGGAGEPASYPQQAAWAQQPSPWAPSGPAAEPSGAGWQNPQPWQNQQPWQNPQPWQGAQPWQAASQPWPGAPQPPGRRRHGLIIGSALGAVAVVAAIVVAVALSTSSGPQGTAANGPVNPPSTLGLGDGNGSSTGSYPASVRHTFINSCESAGSGAIDPPTLASYCTCVFDRLSASLPYNQFLQDERTNTVPPQFDRIRANCAARSGLIGGSGSGDGGS